jgi:hypothetical protein
MTYDKRFFGIYEGLCTNNLDPLHKSRIKLQVPQVLGASETDWAKPCTPVTDNSTHDNHTDTYTSSSATVGSYGGHTHTVTLNSSHSAHTLVPKIGQKVWIMFIAGDPNFPVWMGVEL